MIKNLFCLLVCFILFQAGCSGSSSETGGSGGTSGSPPAADITTAPADHQMAMAAVFDAISSSSKTSGSPPPAALTISTEGPAALRMDCSPFGSIVVPCLGGGSVTLTASAGVHGEYCLNSATEGETGSPFLTFTDLTLSGTLSSCRQPTPAQATAFNDSLPEAIRATGSVQGCEHPWTTNGTLTGVINGTIGLGSGTEGAASMTGQGSTSGECTGLTITFESGRTLQAGYRSNMTMTRSTSGTPLTINISGQVCIDNIHYLLPSREQVNALRTQWCAHS